MRLAAFSVAGMVARLDSAVVAVASSSAVGASPSAVVAVASTSAVGASPSVHRGSIRPQKCRPCEVQDVKILVDTGSQQAPLCSSALARRMQMPGVLTSYATQAGGQPLPVYDIGWCELGLNGRWCPTRFKSAPIAPYDVILGESWMREHGVVMDYSQHTISVTGAGGCRQPLVFDSPAGEAEGPAGQSDAAWPNVSTVGARVRRIERRHESLADVARRWARPAVPQGDMLHVLDFAKELPEDAEIDLGDIPGVAPVDKPSFAFVEDDVRTHLAYLPAAQVDEVVRRLQVFESDVFETRTMPRPAPERPDFDVPIHEKSGAEPPARRPYPVAPHHQAELDRQVQVLLDAGIVRRSYSHYAAPVLFAPKKDGKLRMCVDYRLLNAQTRRDRYPTPSAPDLIARTRGAQLFSKIDLHSGFHQLRMKPTDVHKTAFATPSGLYEWVSAPFGLTSVPGAFQRFMNFVLADHIAAGYCLVYCDDIAIYSASADPMVHLQHVEAVLASLREHQLLAKGAKCEFMRQEAEFLGFLVSGEGVRPLPSKIEAVLQIPAPETVSHVRSFLGMCNFFRAHLPSFSEVSAPLTDLLKGSVNGRQRVAWTLACDHAFAELKVLLTSAPLLRHFDPSLRTAVHVDASQNAVGAVLLQWGAGEEHPRPVCFLSRKFQGAQYKYDARNAESLAAQVALAAWRPLLYGVPFELVSDHASLRPLFTQKSPSHRILRLCEFLADFDFEEVKFIRGAQNVVPDFLSRPWDPAVPDVGLHVLSHPRVARRSSLASLSGGREQLLLLPVCRSRLAVMGVAGCYRLPSACVGDAATELGVAQSLCRALSLPETVPLCHVGGCQGVSLWRADVEQEVAVEGARWCGVDEVVARDHWWRAHFDALRLYGVLPAADGLPGVVASLASFTTSANSSSLLADILQAQALDPFLQQVVAGVEGSDDGTYRDFHTDERGLLCYQRNQDAVPRVCVPKVNRDAVLHAAHGGVLTGHPGSARTAASVAQFFWWPNLHRDVGHFVRSCRVCAAAKSSTGLPMGVDTFTSVPIQPFTHWAMDLIGPLPKSRAGNDLIVTWVDRTSKMIVARALRQGDSSARKLADLTFEAICCQYGIPARLTHDNDVRFRAMWKELWRILHTKITCTSSYNPQSDPAERANRQVLEALRAAVASVTDFDQWDQALPHLCFGLNSHVSSATGTSPFELAHGFPPRVPLTLDLPAHAKLTEDRAAADYALVVQNRQQAAADQVAAAQVRLGRILARRSRPAAVSVGDWLYLDAKPDHSPPHQVPFKLANRWMGPFEAKEVKGAVVRLDLPAELGKYSPWINVRRLKMFEQRDAEFSDDGAPVPLVGADGVLRYEIQRIWGHRPSGPVPGKEYLVQWRGYDTSQMTWVARATLTADVPGLLASYEASPTTAQARTSAPKRAPKPMLVQRGAVSGGVRRSARIAGV